MMYGYGASATTVTGSNGPACRFCGWSCCGGTGCPTGNGNVIVFNVVADRWFDLAEERLRHMLASLKFVASLAIPNWLIELCAVPRSMKRHFPRNLPGPRPGIWRHRSYDRLRPARPRQLRHRSSIRRGLAALQGLRVLSRPVTALVENYRRSRHG